jgi:O-antigen/teichoic acid export membrane protein
MHIPETYRSFIQKSSGYIFFNLIEKLAPFILLPIIIRKVSVEGYGQYSFFLTLESILLPLFSLNLSNCIYREYYKRSEDLSKYISNLCYGYLLLDFAMIGPYVILVLIFNKSLGLTYQICLCLFLTSNLIAFSAILAMLYRLKQKVKNYGLWQIFYSVFMLSMLLASVYIAGTYESLVHFRLIALLVISGIVFVVLQRNNLLGGKFEKGLLIYMLKYSLPTVVYSLAGFAFSFSDRFFIKSMMGAEALGIYSGIYQLSAAILILVTAINSAWMPWMFDKLSTETYEKKVEVVKVSYFMIIALFIIGVLWGLAIPFLSKFMLTEAYYDYLSMAWFFIFAFVFHGVYSVVSPYTYYVGKTKANARIGFISAGFNIALNFILIPMIGIEGPAVSLLITWILQSVMFIYYGQKYYPMPWLLKNNLN